MKWSYLLTLFCLLLNACNPAPTVTLQPTVTAVVTETAVPSRTPVFPTATLYPTSTPESPPSLPAAPTALALHLMRIGEPLKFSSIHMIDEQSGWAIDLGNRVNHILRTRDGGHSWKDVTPYYAYGPAIFSANGFFALDANTAWATTPEMIACSIQNFNCTPIPNTSLMWHTTDGGRHWQGQFVPSLPNTYTPISLQFLDAQTGSLLTMTFIGTDLRYQLYRTTDGGAHWSQAMDVSSRTTPEDPHEKNITAIAFQNPRTAWMSTSEICCEAHLIKEWSIYQSTDSGVTWKKFSLPAPDPLPETFLSNLAECAVQDTQVIPPSILDTIVYCYVYEGLSRPEFHFHYHSGDGGKNWVSFQNTGDVQFIDSLLGWRMNPNEGAYDIERTQDGGVTWTTLKTVQWNGSLHFVNMWVGWALATSGDDVALVHTIDGGRTWEQFSPVVSAQ